MPPLPPMPPPRTTNASPTAPPFPPPNLPLSDLGTPSAPPAGTPFAATAASASMARSQTITSPSSDPAATTFGFVG